MKFSFENLESTFVIAELSANHNGSFEVAKNTIKAAKKAGADAIKLQTYTADTITIKSKMKDFVIKSDSIWDGKYLHELYQEAYTPWEWHEELYKIAHDEGLICFSSPFDKTAVDFLEKINNPIYKIASFEITDIPLIKYIASKGKPIILSTGIASLSDIELAINTIRNEGNNQIALLKCTSSYPTTEEEANLIMIKEFIDRFKITTGLSDHTLGINAPIMAVTLGAKIIEKHFIIDKSIGGPDSSFSLDQSEFALMVEAIRRTEKMLGNVSYKLSNQQKLSKQFSRSLYVTEDIKKGEKFTKNNIRVIRPGYGLPPKYYEKILNKKSPVNISKNEPLKSNVLKSM